MKHYLLSILCCCFLFSCQQDYLVDNVAFTPKLVANSLFTAGSEIEVYVHSTRNVLDSNSSINKIDDAIVTISDAGGNVLATLSNSSNGRYYSDKMNLVAGESYTLEVTKDGFTPITASSVIPAPVDAAVMNSNFVSGGTSESLNVDLQLRDNDTNDNYYVYEVVDDLRLHLYKEEPFKLVNIQNVEILLTSEDQNQERIASNRLLQTRIFLKDESFSNSEYNINFKAKSNPAAAGPVVLTSEEVFSDQKMRVVTASQNMFEYYKSIETHRLKGEANSSVSQPIAVYSNVSNGLGIFAGYSEDVLPLREQ